MKTCRREFLKFSAEALAFPRYAEIPAAYKRSGNPGVVIIVT